jgi:ubiquinone/menaquinone biosynthesis C-methylase UbiE
LGCGRGGDVLKLAHKVGPRGRAIGVDLTPDMLAVARERAAAQGLAQATFLEASLEALPLPDASVDWVVSNCALNHAGDKQQVWREVARVLKPGAHFIVSDIYAVERIADLYRNDPVAVAGCWAGAVTRAEYLEHIAHAGLVEVSVPDESKPYVKAQATLASFTVSGRKPSRGR